MSYIYKLNKNKNITLLFVGIHYFDFYISKYLNNIEKDKIVLLDFRRKNVDRSIMDFLKQRKSEYVLALQSCHTTYLQDNYEIIFQDHFNFYFDVYLIKTKILWNK
jgi:hypothetical protein